MFGNGNAVKLPNANLRVRALQNEVVDIRKASTCLLSHTYYVVYLT